MARLPWVDWIDNRLNAERRAEAVRFARFLAVGILNTLFGYLVFAVALHVSGSASIAIVISAVAGALFNYLSTGKLVFNNAGAGLLPRFILAYVVICAINFALYKAALLITHHPLLAQALSTPLLAVVSFGILRGLIFRRSGGRHA